MTDWNFGLIFKAKAKKAPHRRAQIYAGKSQDWGTFHQSANALAADMLAAETVGAS